MAIFLLVLDQANAHQTAPLGDASPHCRDAGGIAGQTCAAVQRDLGQLPLLEMRGAQGPAFRAGSM